MSHPVPSRSVPFGRVPRVPGGRSAPGSADAAASSASGLRGQPAAPCAAAHAGWAVLLLAAVLLAAACSPNPPASGQPAAAPAPAAPAAGAVPGQDWGTNPDPAAVLKGLTLDQKLGQLLILEFRFWEGKPAEDQTLTPRIRGLMKTIQPGGVILFGENMVDLAQVRSLIGGLEQLAPVPLFVSTDEEGGRVARAGQNGKLGVTLLSSMRTLGKKGPQAVEQAGRQLGRQLRALGINMNLAPVADLDIAEGNPLGNRSFSADPKIAADFVTRMSLAFQAENVSAVLKHFPGLGAVSLDPHKGLPVLPWNEDLLEQRDGLPFRQALAAGADAVMVGHIELVRPGTDPVPATFDEKLLTGILRQKWGYQGLIMTDALNMKAVSKTWKPEEAALRAILAGADLILIPPDPAKTLHVLRQAVSDGTLTQARVDESVLRILKVKRLRQLFDKGKTP